jgi:hypothetical protein
MQQQPRSRHARLRLLVQAVPARAPLPRLLLLLLVVVVVGVLRVSVWYL